MRRNERKLKLHCDVISGYAFSSSDWKEEGIPVIKIGNISNGSDIDCDELQYVDEFFWDKLDPKYHISNGDILVSLTGSHINQPNSMVGRSCRSLTEKNIYLISELVKLFHLIIRIKITCTICYLQRP